MKSEPAQSSFCILCSHGGSPLQRCVCLLLGFSYCRVGASSLKEKRQCFLSLPASQEGPREEPREKRVLLCIGAVGVSCPNNSSRSEEGKLVAGIIRMMELSSMTMVWLCIHDDPAQNDTFTPMGPNGLVAPPQNFLIGWDRKENKKALE